MIDLSSLFLSRVISSSSIMLGFYKMSVASPSWFFPILPIVVLSTKYLTLEVLFLWLPKYHWYETHCHQHIFIHQFIHIIPYNFPRLLKFPFVISISAKYNGMWWYASGFWWKISTIPSISRSCAFYKFIWDLFEECQI